MAGRSFCTAARGLRRPAWLLIASLAVCAVAASAASAAGVTGEVIHVATSATENTNTSDNWFGYNQGTLEKGVKLFTSVSAKWTIPKATQHTAGQAEDSADWIGIGGGCVNAGCTVTDDTLIQTGTEQDVGTGGAASYDAWYELVPAPEFKISGFKVSAGDSMSASISLVVPALWKITISDLTKGETYTTRVPYTSTEDTAEWIEETPLEISVPPSLASLPNLTDPRWADTTVNGANAKLKASERVDLVNSSGSVIGAPSLPVATDNGFSECTWATTCPAY
jgi:hypothetical protein